MLSRSAVAIVGLLILAGLVAGCQMAPQFENEYRRGVWLQEQGRYEAALQAFEQFRLERPDSVLIPMMLVRKGEVYEALGQYDSALDSYREAANLSPTEVGPFAEDRIEALEEKIELMEAEREAEEDAQE